MDAYNHYMLSGERRDIVNRLRGHWGIRLVDDYLERCTHCRQCEEACTQRLPICDRLEEVREEVAAAEREQAAKAGR
jgi:predicted aldo/keto reductase-like oxidoreductase